LNDTRDLSLSKDSGWSIGHKMNVHTAFMIAKRDLDGQPLEEFLANIKNEYD